MDRVAEYRETVARLLREHERRSARAVGPAGVETVLVADPGADRFLLLDVGWADGRRVRDVVLHVAIKGGKIWVEEDWTEEGIATELVRAGVPKEDIVLAFHPPERRHLTEFAPA